MNLFSLRFEVCKSIKSDNWSEENLTNVLRKLKKNKSADSHGLTYELFRPEIIGTDLFTSLLMLCNQVKGQLVIPEFLMFTDITSIYKMKGPKCELDSDRGIFGVAKVRSIIEKLVYQDNYDTIDQCMSDSNVGGRRKRNIRDNLFVIYAIINDAIKNKKSIDIQFYDIAKCFDAMWAEESMNDFYDAGVRDDQFSLISLMNQKCKVKVKTPVGDTERFELNRIEMQGTVPAPLKCAVQMDTLGRYCYTYSTGLYQYKDVCSVPALGMIDDIAGASQCNENSVILNSLINAKIESKKLEFNLKKCVNMHIGPNKENCQQLKVHDTDMLTAVSQTYLGDTICSSGYNTVNINERCKTGHKAISQIKSLLNDANFGKFSVQTGLLLRDSTFVSKVLLNSEVWHSLTKSQINDLEVIDRILLRDVLKAHCKTGLEWIYADTGKLNLRSLIQIRRLMYLWHLNSRDKSELINRIYTTQKISNNVGDWVKLVEADMSELGITLTDEQIQGVSKNMFKNYVKKQVKINQLKYLSSLKTKHSKAKFLDCSSIKMADYLKDPNFTSMEKKLLFKLRSKTLDVKQNFHSQYQNPWCSSCGLFQETQKHLLQCPQIVPKLGYLCGKTSTLNENFVYGSIEQQQIIVKIYSDILEVRENLQAEIEA